MDHIFYNITKFAEIMLPKPEATGTRLASVINVALAVLGAICVLIITLAGLQFILSSGDPQKVAKARQTIIYAVSGVIVAVVAAAIVNLVIARMK